MKKKEYRMVDVHCHVLYGVDDGARDIGVSAMMLQSSAEECITDIIATPHYKYGRKNASTDEIEKLCTVLNNINKEKGTSYPRIYYGMEIFLFHELIDYLMEGKLLTLNGSNRILIEFMPNVQYSIIRNIVDDVVSEGYVPVLAHVERYDCLIKDMELMYELKSLGAEIQINVSSAMGKMGYKIKKVVRKLLKNQLVDYVGTDAHDCKKRTVKALDFIKKAYNKYDEDYVDAILYENAVHRLNIV